MKVMNKDAGFIVYDIIKTIESNVAYLSEIDGKIGDGDHGINMNKGFAMCGKRLDAGKYGLSESLEILSRTLMEDIGGSMGPLYGILFDGMSAACKGVDEIDSGVFGNMLKAGLEGIHDISSAKIGDKTLLDTLIPAVEGYSMAISEGKDFYNALNALKDSATAGWKSTEGMVAKLGRASRLGERSRGVVDAGATSCCLILHSIGDSIQKIIKENK